METSIAHTSGKRKKTFLVSTFLGNVVHVTSHYDGDKCSLTAQEFQLDQLQRKFIANGQETSLKIQAKHVNYAIHGLVENDVTGLVNLYMVAETESGKQWTYYVLQVTTCAIKFISQFYLPYQISKNNVHLTAGPRVVWVYRDSVMVYNSLEKTQKMIARHWNGGELLWSGIIGSDLVTFGRVKNLQGDKDGMDASLSIMSFPNRYHFERISLRSELQKSSSMFKLIPEVYAEIITAMNVNNDDSVVICTSESQLISFKDGEIQNICQLPFKDPVTVEFAVVSGRKELIVVQLASSEVCSVWSKSFEIAKTWKNISKVLVDDFFMCGSDQLLMLDKDYFTSVNIFSGFTLTNLQRCNISDGEGEEDDDMMGSQSNLKSAVKALETRMQVSVAAVKETRLKLGDKIRMIHQSHNELINMATGMNIENKERTDEKASLICLYDGSPDVSMATTHTTGTDNLTERLPFVSLPWQCLVGDQWVVGLKIQNSTSKSLDKLALSLIARDDKQYPIMLQSRSRLCLIPSQRQEDMFEEPLLKRMKTQPEKHKPSKGILLPDESIYVCAVANLPAFNRPYLVCNLVLQWKDCMLDASQQVRSICIGDVALLASDAASDDIQVTCEQFSGSLTDQEEMSLNAVQLETLLDVTSHYSNINQVDSIIQNALKFLPMTNSSGFMCASGAFRLCRIYITVLNAKNLKAQVFTRDEKALHLLIHSLNDALPDDIIITPTQSIESLNSATKNALEKLEEELTSRLQILTHQMSSQGMDPKTPCKAKEVEDKKDESKSVDDWRKEFANEQALSKSRSSGIKIEGQIARTIQTKDLSRKVETDTAFMDLARLY